MSHSTERITRVLVWSENTEPREVYPSGTHGAVAAFLNRQPDIRAVTAELADPDSGVSEAALTASDVLIWWGHKKHDDVPDEAVERVIRHVTQEGLGFLPIHSAHYSRPFKGLLGTGCGLGSWKEEGQPESLFVVAKGHPIVEGVGGFVLPQTEHYGEPFDVPEPDELILRSTWEDGTWFRSGCLWRRGNGSIFYFRPGHETYKIMDDASVQRILTNAVRYLARGRQVGHSTQSTRK